jgi:hypothetical protein
MNKDWNKHKKLPSFAMDTSNICWVLQHKSLPCFSSVGYHLYCNPITNNLFLFTRRRVTCWTTCFCMDKAWFHFSAHSKSKQQNMECWKPMWNAWKPSSLVKDRCLVHSVLKTNCGTTVLWKENYCEKLSNLLTQFIALPEEKKQNCWFQQAGATAHTMKTITAFLQACFSDHILRCGLW